MKNILPKVLILLGVLGGIFALYTFTPLKTWFSWEAIAQNIDLLKTFVSEHYLLFVLAYILAYTLSTAFSLPIGLYLTVTGGFLFGGLLGGTYVVVGATLGAMILFFVVRFWIGEGIQKQYGQQLESFNKQVEEKGNFFFVSVRLMFFLPFFVINLLAGLTKVKASTYFFTTFFGIMPGTFAYAFLGASLSGIQEGEGLKLPWEALVGLTLLGLITLLPAFLKKKSQKAEG